LPAPRRCPFDTGYQPIFNAVAFAVYDLGFVARCALEDDDAGEVRLTRIQRIIDLPTICGEAELEPERLTFIDLSTVVTDWLRMNR
jgi:hypothetical protein